MRRILITAAVLLLGGCATMSQEACLQGDWGGQGFKDGEAGFAVSRLDDHAKACAKAGVTPDAKLYFAARADGLKRYCTPDRGFREGRTGQSYAGVCPEPAARDFLFGYADGQRVHAAQARLSQAESDLSSADARAERSERDGRGVEQELKNPALTDAQTHELRDRLNRLRAQHSQAVEEGRRAERDRYDASREVDALRARFTRDYGPW